MVFSKKNGVMQIDFCGKVVSVIRRFAATFVGVKRRVMDFFHLGGFFLWRLFYVSIC